MSDLNETLLELVRRAIREEVPRLLPRNSEADDLQCYSVEHAARLLDCSAETVREHIHKRRLRATKPEGSPWKIKRADLKAFIEGRTEIERVDPDEAAVELVQGLGKKRGA